MTVLSTSRQARCTLKMPGRGGARILRTLVAGWWQDAQVEGRGVHLGLVPKKEGYISLFCARCTPTPFPRVGAHLEDARLGGHPYILVRHQPCGSRCPHGSFSRRREKSVHARGGRCVAGRRVGQNVRPSLGCIACRRARRLSFGGTSPRAKSLSTDVCTKFPLPTPTGARQNRWQGPKE